MKKSKKQQATPPAERESTWPLGPRPRPLDRLLDGGRRVLTVHATRRIGNLACPAPALGGMRARERVIDTLLFCHFHSFSPISLFFFIVLSSYFLFPFTSTSSHWYTLIVLFLFFFSSSSSLFLSHTPRFRVNLPGLPSSFVSTLWFGQNCRPVTLFSSLIVFSPFFRLAHQTRRLYTYIIFSIFFFSSFSLLNSSCSILYFTLLACLLPHTLFYIIPEFSGFTSHSLIPITPSLSSLRPSLFLDSNKPFFSNASEEYIYTIWVTDKRNSTYRLERKRADSASLTIEIPRVDTLLQSNFNILYTPFDTHAVLEHF